MLKFGLKDDGTNEPGKRPEDFRRLIAKVNHIHDLHIEASEELHQLCRDLGYRTIAGQALVNAGQIGIYHPLNGAIRLSGLRDVTSPDVD
tara:strand:+ start:347 stop:616 length:270 start_codon:yes stop_codon:yes gene_type:complete